MARQALKEDSASIPALGKLSRPFRPARGGVLADELFEYLKDAILAGELEPGTKLVEDTVARATSVSRTPVREALRRLRSTGLIKSNGRTFEVSSLSSEDLRDLWFVMEHLQVLAAQLAAQHRSAIDLIKIHHIVSLNRAAMEEGDYAAMVDLNRRFHSAIHDASGNRCIAEVISNLVMRIEALQDFSSARWREEAIEDHVELLAAIEAQDPERSGNAMRAHLEHQLTAAIAHTPG
ncbi:MAG: GntR family transcriptional regulator [Streptosporangiaceae bacterium]